MRLKNKMNKTPLPNDEQEVLEAMKRISKAIGVCRPHIAAEACLRVIQWSLMLKEAEDKKLVNLSVSGKTADNT